MHIKLGSSPICTSGVCCALSEYPLSADHPASRVSLIPTCLEILSASALPRYSRSNSLPKSVVSGLGCGDRGLSLLALPFIINPHLPYARVPSASSEIINICGLLVILELMAKL